MKRNYLSYILFLVAFFATASPTFAQFVGTFEHNPDDTITLSSWSSYTCTEGSIGYVINPSTDQYAEITGSPYEAYSPLEGAPDPLSVNVAGLAQGDHWFNYICVTTTGNNPVHQYLSQSYFSTPYEPPTPTTSVPQTSSSVQTASTELLSGFQTGSTSVLSTMIPIAFVLLISVAVIYFVVKHFRRNTRV